MVGVWMTPCKNGQCELSVRRDGVNKIVIATQTQLTDAQAEELFWCVGAMQRSGKTLKDLLKEQDEQISTLKDNFSKVASQLAVQQEVVRCKDCKYYHKPEYGFTYGDCTYCSVWLQVSTDDFCSKGRRKDT